MKKSNKRQFKNVEQKTEYFNKIERTHIQIIKLLKRIRIANNITINDVVNKTGLSKKVIEDLESYNGNPKMKTFIKYCDAINLNLIDLLHGKLNFVIVGIDKEEGKVCYQNKYYLKR